MEKRNSIQDPGATFPEASQEDKTAFSKRESQCLVTGLVLGFMCAEKVILETWGESYLPKTGAGPLEAYIHANRHRMAQLELEVRRLQKELQEKENKWES